MFNPVFTDPNNALLKDRLDRISEQLRTLTLSTVEDYQADVYSAVNAVLSLGLAMTPLQPIGQEGPATVGDASDNYTILNNDAQDIANEILRIEDNASQLFNLAATSQNQLRQQIREFVFASNKTRYVEDFLNTNALGSVTATIDFNAGLATNTLLDETDLSPVITVGTDAVGSIDSSSSLANLTDGRVDSTFTWNGATLELVLTFPTPQIMNRLSLNLDNYNELEIDTFTTSPDGTLVEDVLGDLNVDRILLDGTSSKFSGDIIIDFPPRHVSSARLIINDRVGNGLIALRELACTLRRYSTTGLLTSNAINAPTGNVLFTTQENTFSPFVSITHQISYDGTQFIAITPNTVIALQSNPFFYRAVLERNTSAFETTSGPLIQSPLDPIASSNYTLVSTTTTPSGNGISQRTLLINNVTGPIILRDNPMPNTLIVQEGSVILSIEDGDYTFNDNTVSFPSGVTGLTISYQTTSLGATAVKDREEYYTSLLYEFKFEKE